MVWLVQSNDICNIMINFVGLSIDDDEILSKLGDYDA